MKLAAKIFTGIISLIVMVLAAWTFITLHYTYSSGERAGYVQKISNKGWFCKTWEGELAMANLPGAMPQIFEFTVTDDTVARQINERAGQHLVLHYEQHKGIPTSCFGDTEYFIVQVTPVADTLPAPVAPSPPPAPAPAPK